MNDQSPAVPTGEAEDALSDVLRLIRLKGCVYFLSDFSAPWGMRMEVAPVAQFHLVARGQCWLVMGGERRLLSSGDVVLFPHGAAHALCDDPQSACVPGIDVLRAIKAGEGPFQSSDRQSSDRQSGDPSTRLLCGHFEFDREMPHPLVRELPGLIHIEGMARRQPGWLDAIAPMLVGESANAEPGAETIVDRLAKVLFIQVLRTFLATQRRNHGFLAALTDRRINRALKIIHSSVETELTLVEIARAVGMSRSNLAARFKAVLGMAPMAYLASWRMLRAKELLRAPESSLAQVAGYVGYSSEAAFSRAFKRTFRQSPSDYRRSLSAHGD